MRENRATVTDPSLTEQFADGLREGLRLDGYCMVIFTVGEDERIVPAVRGDEVHRTVADFTRTLRGEDFEAGVTIRILAADAPGATTATVAQDEVAGLPDGVEDAEIVEN